MSRVLIWKKYSAGSEYDIFRGTDCLQEYNWHTTFNVGNRLWFQGIMSAIDTKENHYDFLSDELTTEKINEEYDFIILPMANIFSNRFRHYLEATTFEKVKIPVYVIACGAQADNYSSIDLLINDIGEISKRFISAIYSTGGEFALRGYFTKEFFERLGFSSAVVTGCPSMFQLGRNFQAISRKQNLLPTKPVFNGNISILDKLMDYYPESILIDQDVFWRDLYSKKAGNSGFRQELTFYCNHGIYSAKLLGADRLRLIPDMYNWSLFLQKVGFDYSFGSRIHGNIMSILSGIPATVVAIDSRTQEMAEFFDIPFVRYVPGHSFTPDEFVQMYATADYTKFNETYSEKYDAFEHFLVKHGIVSHVNQNNMFWDNKQAYVAPPQVLNANYYEAMYHKLNRRKLLMSSAKCAVTIKNKLAR